MPEIIAEVDEGVDITAHVAATPGSLTDDYNDLQNHPSINGVELEGDKTTSDLHIDHVPLADNLVATTGTTDTTPYVSRASQGPIAELRKVVGGTLAWNQLCNAASVTLTSGHKYFMMKSGTASVASSDGTAITGLTSGTDMVIDLTQMFGSTVADAIYTKETATAGSGVALFRSLFPSDYYPYSAPTLASVQTSARQALDGNGNVTRSYPLDSDLTLRGIPKLTNGKLEYDGDEYLPSGQVARRYWEFDLGSVTFYQVTGHDHMFYYALSNSTTEGHARKYGNNASGVAFQVNGYTFWGNNTSANIYAGVGNMQVAGFATTYSIVIRNDSCSTPAELKTALNGVHIVYPLETPTTESADPYTEVQLAGSSEQFVMENYIPVGNETFYPTDLTGVVQNLAPLPTTAGTYKLQVTVSGGVPSYSWVAG